MGRATRTHAAVRHTRDGSILRITLDRPAQRNSLSHAMVDELVAVFTAAATDDLLRAVYLTGAGGDFCAGADWVATNSDGRRSRTGDLTRRIPHTANRVVELIASVQLPVVCGVRGWAVGLGCNLALAADFTVAGTDATLSGTLHRPRVQSGFRCDLAAAPTRGGGPGQTHAASRRQGVGQKRRRMGSHPPGGEPRPISTRRLRRSWPGWPPARRWRSA